MLQNTLFLPFLDPNCRRTVIELFLSFASRYKKSGNVVLDQLALKLVIGVSGFDPGLVMSPVLAFSS